MQHFCHDGLRGMPVTPAVRQEERHGESIAPMFIGKVPSMVTIQPDQRFHPSVAVQIRPLVGEAQMRLDDRGADGLQVEHPAVVSEMPPNPVRKKGLQFRLRSRLHRPVVEHALRCCQSRRMPDPAHFAIQHSYIR